MKQILLRASCAALMLALVPVAPVAAVAAVPAPAAVTAPAAGPAPGSAADGILAQIPDTGRYVIVDAASARLFMIEDGSVRDSMKVVVGKRGSATPVVKGTLYYATLNPYWYVPPDLARRTIAPNVLRQGVRYLRARGYEVVSGFVEGAQLLDPSEVDWKAVAAGRQKAWVRQRPGPGNSMGRMKFSFAHDSGIFLHDTPQKKLFESEQRAFSNGCIRLEDAPRFARWLLGHEPSAAGDAPEQHVLLPQAVPVVVSYLDDGARTRLAGMASMERGGR